MNQSASATANEDLLIQILEDYLASLQAGQVPDKRKLLAEHPELREDLETCFDSLEFVSAAAEKSVPLGAASPAGSEPSASNVLGDYRLIREIGRGGMGVVYEAEQISLARRVALKVLPFASMLDPRQLARFKNEAQAAAQLHHTNIVPVFAVGCERAVHYYAMQFIEGQTLADVIRASAGPTDVEVAASQRVDAEMSSAHGLRSTVFGSASTARTSNGCGCFRGIAEIGVQIAEALEHAHQMGVVHRDIKPSNVLLDGRGKVWVTDFGLAQFQSDAGLTMTGDLLGTLRYMSPEAVSGNSSILDHCTDIYSLGVTIYELLALRPAFGGDDRQALLRRIVDEDPPPPRRFNKSIPAELETIVLKCMSKEHGMRYATARELADDLQRFLQDRPITARRPTAVQRAMKFTRRHRGVVATMITSLAVLLMTITIGTSLAAIWLSQERDAANTAKGLAEERLFETLLSQAQASRMSNRSDRLFESRHAIRDAAELAPQLDVTAEQRLRLRNEAVAGMALSSGLREIRRWPQLTSGWALDFDPELRHYARSDHEGTIVIRRVEDNSVIARLGGSGTPATVVRFSHHGTFLCVSYSDGHFRIWNVKARKVIVEMPPPERYLAFDFSPDDSVVAIADHRGRVHLYGLPFGDHHESLVLDSPAECVRFHPDGNTLTVSRQSWIECWDIQSSRLVRRFRQPGRDRSARASRDTLVNRMAWSHDGCQLLTVIHDRAHVWDVDRGEESFVIREPDGFYGVMFSRHGDLLGASTHDGVTVWDAISGEKLVSKEGKFVRFNRGGNRLAFDDGHTVGVSEVVVSDVYRTCVPRTRRRTRAVAVSRRWPLIATASDDGVRLWAPERRRELAFLPIQPIKSLTFHAPSSSLMISTPSGLFRWPIAPTGQEGHLQLGPPVTLDGPTDGWAFAGAVSLSPDQRYLARCLDPGTVRVFDLARLTDLDGNGTLTPAELDVRQHWNVCNVALSNDADWAVTAAAHGEDVWLWDLSTQEPIRKLWEGASHSSTTFSPDGTWCLVVSNTEYQLFESETWRRQWRIPRDGTNQWPGPLAFSPGGNLLAIESEWGLRIVDCAGGRELFSLQSPGRHRSVGVCFSPDGRLVLEVSADRVGIWDLERIQSNLANLQLNWDSQRDASPSENDHNVDLLWSLREAVKSIEIDYGELFRETVAKTHVRAARRFAGDEFYGHALNEYERALAIHPDDAWTSNNLAWLYATGPEYLRSPERALTFAERAAELEPENANFLNTLGVARYRRGLWQETIDALVESIRLDASGGTAFDFFFLAMSYHKSGNVAKAHEFYDKAVAWWNAQPAISDAWHKELVAFRAEADALFKSKSEE